MYLCHYEINRLYYFYHTYILGILINNISKSVIVCSLCFTSNCVYVINAIAGSVSLGPVENMYA